MYVSYYFVWILLLTYQVYSNPIASCIRGCRCEEKSVYCRDILFFTPGSFPQRTVNLTITQSFIGPNLGISFSPLMNLEELDLSNNGLHTISSGVFNFLSRLRKLNLSKNRLVRFDDDAFKNLGSLETLDLSQNDFFILPDVPFRPLKNLLVFNISYNKLTELKLGLRFQVMEKLNMLDLSGNSFSDIAADAFEMTYPWQNNIPKTVNLSFCGIRSIHPDTFRYPIKLTQLSIAGNPELNIENLTSIFNSTNLQELTHLDISSMNLTDIADILKSLRGLSLSKLNLNNNSISDMPLQLRDNLRGLKTLLVNRNNLQQVSPAITEIASLRHVDLSHNEITEIHESFTQYLINLRTLDLSFNKLGDDSVSVDNCVPMYNLDISFNMFTKFETPSSLVNLKTLNLAGNQITELQPLTGLRSLEFFDISLNRLKELGPFIFSDSAKIDTANFSGNTIDKVNHQAFRPNSPQNVDFSNNSLIKLWNMGWETTKSIDLHGNMLEAIDDQAFYALYSLKNLDLSGNNLVSLQPNSLVFLTNLSQLHIRNNQLYNPHEPVRSFKPLEMLEVLDMGFNNFTSFLPETFKKCKRLRTIKLNNNLLTNLNPSIFSDLRLLKEVDLSDNHFICNCELFDFKYWLKETKIKIMHLSNTSYHCSGPSSRLAKEITQYDVGDFECNQTLLLIIIFSSVGGLVLFVAMVFALVCHFYCKWRKRRKFDFDRCSIQYEAMNQVPMINGQMSGGKLHKNSKAHMNGVLPQHKISKVNLDKEVQMLLKAEKANRQNKKDQRNKRKLSNDRHHVVEKHTNSGKRHRAKMVKSDQRRHYSDTENMHAHLKRARLQGNRHPRFVNKSRSEIDLRPYLSRREFGAMENAMILRNPRNPRDQVDVVRMPYPRPKLSFSVPDMLDQTRSMPRSRRTHMRPDEFEYRGDIYNQGHMYLSQPQRLAEEQTDRRVQSHQHIVQPTIHAGYYTIGAKRSSNLSDKKSEWI